MEHLLSWELLTFVRNYTLIYQLCDTGQSLYFGDYSLFLKPRMIVIHPEIVRKDKIRMVLVVSEDWYSIPIFKSLGERQEIFCATSILINKVLLQQIRVPYITNQ